MTPEQKDAVVELVLNHLSVAEFVERTGLDPIARPGIVETELRSALASHDAGTVSGALMLMFRFELLTGISPLCLQSSFFCRGTRNTKTSLRRSRESACRLRLTRSRGRRS